MTPQISSHKIVIIYKNPSVCVCVSVTVHAYVHAYACFVLSIRKGYDPPSINPLEV